MWMILWLFHFYSYSCYYYYCDHQVWWLILFEWVRIKFFFAMAVSVCCCCFGMIYLMFKIELVIQLLHFFVLLLFREELFANPSRSNESQWCVCVFVFVLCVDVYICFDICWMCVCDQFVHFYLMRIRILHSCYFLFYTHNQ